MLLQSEIVLLISKLMLDFGVLDGRAQTSQRIVVCCPLILSRVHDVNLQEIEIHIGVINDLFVTRSLDQGTQHTPNPRQFILCPVAGHRYIVV